MTIKEFAKKVIKSLPIAFTQNQKYDSQTKKIIKKVCKEDSHCSDVGAHNDDIDIISKNTLKKVTQLITAVAYKTSDNSL